jgi:hypothetical protein
MGTPLETSQVDIVIERCVMVLSSWLMDAIEAYIDVN